MKARSVSGKWSLLKNRTEPLAKAAWEPFSNGPPRLSDAFASSYGKSAGFVQGIDSAASTIIRVGLANRLPSTLVPSYAANNDPGLMIR